MGHIPTIYCQLGFLERFIAICQPSLIELLSSKQTDMEAITSCFNLLFGTSNIYLDTTPEEILNHENPLISKKLLKNPTATLKCEKDFNGKLNEEDFWQNLTTELFLLDEPDNIAAELEQDWGILIITPDNLHQKGSRLASSSPLFVKKGDNGFSWEHFKESRHCFHTILIADNYLDADENKLKMNLIPLLKALSSGSPRKRKTHLTVFTTNHNVKLLHQKLSTLLPAHGLDFEIRVVKVNKDNNHDRHLITNQRWIFSGYGFNLLKWNASKKCAVTEKTTTLLDLPVQSNGMLKSEDEQNISEGKTYFSAAMGIIDELVKLDNQTPEKIGVEIRAIGISNLKPLTKIL